MKELLSKIGVLHEALIEAFSKLPSKEVYELSKTVYKETEQRGFTYQRGADRIDVLSLMLVPSFFTQEEITYLHNLSLTIKGGVLKVFRNYFLDEEIEEVLPLTYEEKDWFKGFYREARGGAEELWYRLDAHLHMKDLGWKDKISVFEINSSAVGGIHYSPVAEAIFMEVILPVVRDYLPALPPLKKNPDLRELLLGLARTHARGIGRKGLTLAFVEDKTLTEGITEGPYIVDFLQRKGVKAFYVDPRELYVKGDEVYYRDEPLDILYRNFEVRDIIEMEGNREDTQALRFAFSKNQVISTLAGDFDHKSVLEVLTSERFRRYFSLKEAQLFKKHIHWTRVVRGCTTDGPDGTTIDLIPFAVRNKDMFILKPNRMCGGYGITLGSLNTPTEWEGLLKKAVSEEDEWVIQTLGRPEETILPLFEGERLVFDNHNIVYGLSSTHEGTGVLGRASREKVVNVARQGGLVPVLRVG
ncbi:MAG: hypothetical protein HY878_04710 [Deltaproteobacteria bacterium]|nr:hypothetical protein [Deltaproteobacteria bacterium]